MKHFFSFFTSIQTETKLSSKIMLGLQIWLIIAALFLLNTEPCFCTCDRAEYEINGECCPMCAAGSHVYRHCTEFISTTCVPCANSTYLSESNGLLNCLSCSVCDSEQGLRVKTACTRYSDTVCYPLDGFYCLSGDKGNCIALEHRKCSPGQYVKQKGTAHKDTECVECTDGTFSDGSFNICTQHTKCDDLGLEKIKPGTTTSDVECGHKKKNHLPLFIAMACIIVCIIVAVILGLLFKKRLKFCQQIGRGHVKDTEKDNQGCETTTTQMELLQQNGDHEASLSPSCSRREDDVL